MRSVEHAAHGYAGEHLLASYSAERLPVIKQVIDTTHFLTRAMGTSTVWAQALRDAVIPMVSRLAPFQHAFVERLSELGIAYRGSPIVEGAGRRYFDDSIRGGSGIRSRYLLMLDAAALADVVDEARRLTQTFDGIIEVRPHASREITLVRPDGYVAFSASDRDGAAATRDIDALLRRRVQMMQPSHDRGAFAS